MSGLFITFEGIEHCGKTTQSERLAERLRKDGHTVILTREPGGTSLGLAIRELLLHSPESVSDLPELLLFAADRAHHVDTKIRPALADGQIVISDRFFDSTRAYQGYGRAIEADLIDRAISLATGGLTPDVSILLDIDVSTSRSRGDDETDRIEQDSDQFFERVRDGFLDIAKQEPDRFLVLDGTRSIEDVGQAIEHHLRPFLSRLGG